MAQIASKVNSTDLSDASGHISWIWICRICTVFCDHYKFVSVTGDEQWRCDNVVRKGSCMCQSSTLVSTELRTRVIKWGFYNIQESNTIAHYLSILGPASNRDLICGTNDKMCRPIMPQTVRMPSQWHSLRLQRSASCNYHLLKVIKNHTYLLLHYNKLNYYLMTLNYAKCSCFCICDYVWNSSSFGKSCFSIWSCKPNPINLRCHWSKLSSIQNRVNRGSWLVRIAWRKSRPSLSRDRLCERRIVWSQLFQVPPRDRC